MENGEEEKINNEKVSNVIKNKEIKLNFKTLPLIIVFIIICTVIGYLLGKIGTFIMLLKLNLFLNIIVFIVSLLSLVYCVFERKIIMAIFFLLTTIVFFVNFFYPIIK